MSDNKQESQQDLQSVRSVYRAVYDASPEMPPLAVDQSIRKAAANAARSNTSTRWQHWVRSGGMGLAASVLVSVALTATVYLNIADNNPASVSPAAEKQQKKPMFMMQRSRHESAEAMIESIHQLVSAEEMLQAKQQYNRLLHFYPEYRKDQVLKSLFEK